MSLITIESADIVFDGTDRTRAGRISTLAFSFLQEMLMQQGISGQNILDGIRVPVIPVTFSAMNDEEIARRVADAMYASIRRNC
ncbi:MAG: hypothetical protein LUQ07_07995 [Methanospirillum sp.]|nr:hypothetical protein [Methanospirillum sp.]